MDLITLAIPFFFLFMGVELVVGRLQGRRLFRGKDVATDLALGTLQTVFAVVVGGLLSFLYLKVYEHRLFDLPKDSAFVFAVAFVGVDFCYYWFHRSSHRVMLLWASHAPHHSSEDYNLAVALRQGPVQPLFSRFFYLPLALAGVSYEIFALMVSINTLYQFWVHTELIGKLGPIEYVLNTPSHHRVHHGCNARYLDKNHAGIFIVWDRLFGSFVEESDDPAAKPVYGTVKPLTTWNPLSAAWAPFADIGRKIAASRSAVDVVRAVFGPPEWLPAGMSGAPAVSGPRAKHDGAVSAGVARYVAVSFVVVLAASVVYLFAGVSGVAGVVVAAWLAWSFGSLGALLDGARWAWWSEALRGLAAVAIVVVLR